MVNSDNYFGVIARHNTRKTNFRNYYEKMEIPEDVLLAFKMLYYREQGWYASIDKSSHITRARSTGLKRTITNFIKDMPEFFDEKPVTQMDCQDAIIQMCSQSRKYNTYHLSAMRKPN
jgi:hypothetical protein